MNFSIYYYDSDGNETITYFEYTQIYFYNADGNVAGFTFYVDADGGWYFVVSYIYGDDGTVSSYAVNMYEDDTTFYVYNEDDGTLAQMISFNVDGTFEFIYFTYLTEMA